MMRKLQKRLVIVLTIAVALCIAVLVVGRQAPAGAQSFSVNQGRYQFINLHGETEVPGGHYAIFDTETGVLQEWTGKREGEMWTYSFRDGRELLRRNITVR